VNFSLFRSFFFFFEPLPPFATPLRYAEVSQAPLSPPHPPRPQTPFSLCMRGRFPDEPRPSGRRPPLSTQLSLSFDTSLLVLCSDLFFPTPPFSMKERFRIDFVLRRFSDFLGFRFFSPVSFFFQSARLEGALCGSPPLREANFYLVPPELRRFPPARLSCFTR